MAIFINRPQLYYPRFIGFVFAKHKIWMRNTVKQPAFLKKKKKLHLSAIAAELRLAFHKTVMPIANIAITIEMMHHHHQTSTITMKTLHHD